MNRHTSPELQKYLEIEERAAQLVDAVMTFSEVPRVSVAALFDAYGEDDHTYLRHAIHRIGATGLLMRQIYDAETDNLDLYIVPDPLADAA